LKFTDLNEKKPVELEVAAAVVLFKVYIEDDDN
jgi:hypothetical protein